MSADDDLLGVLRAVLAVEDSDAPADNEVLATSLGWDLERVSAALEQAKELKLIWGHRGSRQPGPWFTELEVTVQGKRRLRS